jgi:hypothetical protein
MYAPADTKISGGRTIGRAVSDAERRAFLATLEIPEGIQEEILFSCRAFPLRIWIIDNSGSMATGDGHMVKDMGTQVGLQVRSFQSHSRV